MINPENLITLKLSGVPAAECLFIWCNFLLLSLFAACWQRDYAKRPSFVGILKDVKLMECSDFCVTTTHEEFRSMQTLWRSKIQMRFVELKKMEHVSF